MRSKNKPSIKQSLLRQMAETTLTTTRAKVKTMSPEEVQHLVHELQVHQIELEMQNEELRKSQLELEVARDRYATLFDFTPVGYVTLDEKGRILESNLRLCHLLGLSRRDIVHTKFEQYMDLEDKRAFFRYLDSLKQNEGTHPSDVLTLQHPNTPHRVRLEGCLETKETPGMASLFRIAVEDVTMQERIEIAQEEQKALMAMVMNGVMEAIVTTDEDERIVLFNEAAEKMFHCSASKALGQTIDRFIPERFRAALHMQNRQFEQEGIVFRQMGVARETAGLRTDGKEFPVEMTISQIEVNRKGKEKGKEKGKKMFTVVLRDITERRKAQEALKKEQLFVSNVLETAGALLVILDPQWQILRMNRLSEQLLQHSIASLQGKPFWHLWVSSGGEAEGGRQGVESFDAGKLSGSFESPIVDKDLQIRWIHWNTTAIYDEQHVVENFIATGLDVTARKQAEITLQQTYQREEGQQRELRSLAAQLLTAQEEERRRISRDLHDDVNQRLALLSLKLQTVQKGLPDSHTVTAMLQEIYEGVADLSDDIRHLAYQYHPSILDDLGLGTALRSLCEDFAKWEGPSVTWEVPVGARKFTQSVATCLYRVAQESLRNVVRHAQASAIHLVLKEDGQGITLSVCDNGKGFVVDGLFSGGLGFVSMRERARLVGGTLWVDSQPGQGTTVRVSIPLSAYT